MALIGRQQGRENRNPGPGLPVLRTGGYFFFFKINKFIYLFLAALALRCCTQAFSSCGKRGLLFVAASSLVAEHEL